MYKRSGHPQRPHTAQHRTEGRGRRETDDSEAGTQARFCGPRSFPLKVKQRRMLETIKGISNQTSQFCADWELSLFSRVLETAEVFVESCLSEKRRVVGGFSS